MTKRPPPNWSVPLFRWSLWLYPAHHRRRFGAEMIRMYLDGWAEEGASGVFSRLLYQGRTFKGLTLNACWVRRDEIKRRRRGIRDKRAPERQGGTMMLRAFWGDLQFAFRGFARRPGVAAAAIMILGLAIGAGTAIFSVVEGVLLRPLPYRQPERLVHLYETNPFKGWTRAQTAAANLLDWRKRNRVFEDIAAYSYFGENGIALELDDEILKVNGASATGNFFSLLGVQPALGRLFLEDETWKGGAAVAVLSHEFWRRQFGADRAIVGKALDLNGQSTLIVGVTPREFQVPGVKADIWTPTRWDPKVIGVAVWTRRAHWLYPVARLKPDVTLSQARADLSAIASALEAEYPETNVQMGAGMMSWHEWIVGDIRTAIWLLLGAVLTVLLIACANVANLLLARGSARSPEMAVRSALGAGRLRIMFQSMTESLLHAFFGTVFGVFLAWLGIAWLKAVGPQDIPRLAEIGLNSGVLVFAVLAAFVTSLLFGAAPAWVLGRTDAVDWLRSGMRQKGDLASWGNLRRILAAGEVALSLILVVAAGLLGRSLIQLQGVDPGFDTQHVLAFEMDLDKSYDAPRANDLNSRLFERLQALPSVRSVAATDSVPLGTGSWTGDASFEGQEDYIPEFTYRGISTGYLATMGVRLIEGRDFAATDDRSAPAVVLVNETFARFSHEPLLGRRIKLSKPDGDAPWLRVVGIVGDERFRSLDRPASPQVYRPLRQKPAPTQTIVLKTEGPPEELFALMPPMVRDLDSSISVYDLRTMRKLVQRSVAEERFLSQLVSAFAALALILAVVGLYATLSYSVARRRSEFGVRLALGARAKDVLALVLREGMMIAGAGTAVGLLGAWALSRFLQGLLFETSALDPLVFVLVSLVLMATALAACWRPARRAAAVDPQTTLRCE